MELWTHGKDPNIAKLLHRTTLDILHRPGEDAFAEATSVIGSGPFLAQFMSWLLMVEKVQLNGLLAAFSFSVVSFLLNKRIRCCCRTTEHPQHDHGLSGIFRSHLTIDMLMSVSRIWEVSKEGTFYS